MTEPTGRTLTVHGDIRGSVRESFRASWFRDIPPIVQIVHSESEPNVMRAMHAHKVQWDIWHLTAGRALVQLYDHRNGDHFPLWIDAGQTIAIPPGVSHGFYTPTGCTLVYALTREFDGTDEYEWNAYDSDFPGANLWPFQGNAIQSERDKTARPLADFIAAW